MADNDDRWADDSPTPAAVSASGGKSWNGLTTSAERRRDRCECELDETGQVIRCAWCRVKSFRAMSGGGGGNWSADLTSSTTESYERPKSEFEIYQERF
jgi:hypothetical protein